VPSGDESPFPYATHEIPGRGSLPLGASNPEVRRSRTEVFERGFDPLVDRAPHRARSRNNLVMVAGVAAVVLIGALVLSLRHNRVVPPTPAGAAATGVAAPGVPSNPTAARGPAIDPTSIGATGDGVKLDGAKSDTKSHTKSDANSDTNADTKKADGKRHHRRSSREAIDALHVPGNGSPAEPATPGIRTPAELKNPFVP
jgi:hypothetical protein